MEDLPRKVLSTTVKCYQPTRQSDYCLLLVRHFTFVILSLSLSLSSSVLLLLVLLLSPLPPSFNMHELWTFFRIYYPARSQITEGKMTDSKTDSVAGRDDSSLGKGQGESNYFESDAEILSQMSILIHICSVRSTGGSKYSKYNDSPFLVMR